MTQPTADRGAFVASARALAAAADLDEATTRLLAIAAEHAGAETLALYLHDEAQATLEPIATHGLMPSRVSLAEAAHPAVRCAVSRRAIRLDDATPRLFLPLTVSPEGTEELVGVLAAGFVAGHRPGAAEEELLGALADLLGVAIDRARLLRAALERSEWFDRIAQIDPLTGLANRRTFDRVLELELVRAARQGTRVTVALFDIDGLAAVNERDGAAAGDDLLRRVATVLTETVRLVDTAARVGSDEFALVAPGSAGAAVAERVVTAMARDEAAGEPRIRLSVGVAAFPEDGGTTDELLAAAETALHAAKAGGGGRVSVANAKGG